MYITQQITWPATNWPQSGPAGQYAVFQVYPAPSTLVALTTTTSATLTYDDTANLAFQVRPTDGTNYGPEVLVSVVGYVPCRAWLRQGVRMALADRADQAGVTVSWPDDEINRYIQEALGELNVTFPIENSTTIMLAPPTVDTHGNQAGVRTYPLPTDFYLVKRAEYVTPDGKLHLYLKDKPWRGGETTATSYLGYPKLGIMLSPLAGRFYPGHYMVSEGNFVVDWDPAGNGDYVNVTYAARRLFPSGDADLLQCTPEDMELLSLYTQMKCWLRTEGSDTRLSRWKEGKRDDMPTIKQSSMIKQLYDQRVWDRRETRVRSRRLVRR